MNNNILDYKNLRKIQQVEKNFPPLTKIKAEFYDDISKYLEYLNTRLKKESHTQKNKLLRDEIQNTKKIAENIYEMREKKIILAVLSKARGGTPDLNNLLKEEKTLFSSILQLMLNSRKEAFSWNSKKCIKNEKQDYSIKVKKHNENKNPIVMVTENIPKFIGIDMKQYTLRKNDLISLSQEISKTLIKRDAAKQIN